MHIDDLWEGVLAVVGTRAIIVVVVAFGLGLAGRVAIWAYCLGFGC